MKYTLFDPIYFSLEQYYIIYIQIQNYKELAKFKLIFLYERR